MKKIRLDIYHTASMDVDPQMGFSELCPSELPVPGALEIANELNKQASFGRIRCASKDAHPSNGIWIATPTAPQFSLVAEPNVDIRWNRHCQVGTVGMNFLPGLPEPLVYNFIAYKGIEFNSHPYGACFADLKGTRSTGLIEFLKVNKIDNVILGGLALNFCVGTTAYQLKDAGFKVIVNLAATRGIEVTPGACAEYINKLKNSGINVIENLDSIISR